MTTRNRTFLTLAVVAVLAIFTASDAEAAVLFGDTFDRADSSDLNASATGKSGTLGALNWVEVVSGGNPAIDSNQMRFGESGGGGGGWTIAYVDHNFTDAPISTGGEFTVSVDLVGPVASGGGTRFTGFAVGNSKAEMDGWSSNNPTTTFTSDFFFGYDTTGTNEVKVFINGTTQDYQQGINLDSGGALSVNFSSITDFNSGSTVNYEAFINGGSVKTGSFTWSGTNENYMALYSNYTSNQGLVDNFEVTAITAAPPAVPEPSTFALAALGLLGLIGFGFRRKR